VLFKISCQQSKLFVHFLHELPYFAFKSAKFVEECYHLPTTTEIVYEIHYTVFGAIIIQYPLLTKLREESKLPQALLKARWYRINIFPPNFILKILFHMPTKSTKYLSFAFSRRKIF
jgi:hypothetical protein